MHLDPSLIARLDDRDRIIEAAYRLFWALDTQRWESLAESCVPELEAQWDDASGPTRSHAGREAFAATAAGALGRLATFHQVTNPLLAIDGDTAELDLLVVGRYRGATLRGADSCIVCANHRQTFRKLDGAWRIIKLQHTTVWTEGNPGLFTSAAPAAKAMAHPVLEPELLDLSDGQRLARLDDRVLIHDLMVRFGQALDGKDWALYRSCFGDRLMLDFSATTGRPAQAVDADAFVAFARLRQRSHASFHQYSNFQLRIDGDRARCILYMMARHRLPESGRGDPLNVFVGWYENEFVRAGQGWKISVLRHPLQWVEGNALIKDAADPEAEAFARYLFATDGAG